MRFMEMSELCREGLSPSGWRSVKSPRQGGSLVALRIQKEGVMAESGSPLGLKPGESWSCSICLAGWLGRFAA